MAMDLKEIESLIKAMPDAIVEIKIWRVMEIIIQQLSLLLSFLEKVKLNNTRWFIIH